MSTMQESRSPAQPLEDTQHGSGEVTLEAIERERQKLWRSLLKYLPWWLLAWAIFGFAFGMWSAENGANLAEVLLISTMGAAMAMTGASFVYVVAQILSDRPIHAEIARLKERYAQQVTHGHKPEAGVLFEDETDSPASA